jgi:multidrug transporter EmrE-like cation transporter
MIFSLFLVLLAVLLTGISQVLMKIGSTHQGKRKDSVLAAYLNLHTLCAYGLLLLVTVISVIALKDVPLKVFYTIASLGFVGVLFFSVVFLRERLTLIKMGATALIIAGVMLFNI